MITVRRIHLIAIAVVVAFLLLLVASCSRPSHVVGYSTVPAHGMGAVVTQPAAVAPAVVGTPVGGGTTVINNDSHGGGGGGFWSSFAGAGIGSVVGNMLSRPSPAAPVYAPTAPAQRYYSPPSVTPVQSFRRTETYSNSRGIQTTVTQSRSALAVGALRPPLAVGVEPTGSKMKITEKCPIAEGGKGYRIFVGGGMSSWSTRCVCTGLGRPTRTLSGNFATCWTRT